MADKKDWVVSVLEAFSNTLEDQDESFLVTFGYGPDVVQTFADKDTLKTKIRLIGKPLDLNVDSDPKRKEAFEKFTKKYLKTRGGIIGSLLFPSSPVKFDEEDKRFI
jgi:hypothetical protein